MLKFIVVVVLTLVSYILIGGVTNLFSFIDIPSLVFIMFFVTVMLLFSGYFKDFFNAFRIISGQNFSTQKIKRSIEAMNLTIVVTLLSGVLGTINGAVILFSTTAYADRLLPSMSVALLTLHYSMLISILLYPIKSMLKGKIIDGEEDE